MPRLLQKGYAAMAAVAQVLPNARPLTIMAPGLGEVTLSPGTIFGGDRMIVLPQPLSVTYVVGDAVYEENTTEFLLTEWLNALSRGASTAAPFITIARVGIALLEGFLAPWTMLLGLSAVQVALLCVRYEDEIRQAQDVAARLIPTLRQIADLYPAYFHQVLRSAANDVLSSLPTGVSAQDVAFLAGRFLIAQRKGPITLLLTAARVAALHLPGILSRAVGNSAWTEVRVTFASAGVSISAEDARAIARELTQPSTANDLNRLTAELDQFAAALLPLADALGRT